MKVFIALIMLFVGGLDQAVEETIVWDEDRKLTWEDFKGTPHGPEGFVASTNSGVAFGYSYAERNGRPRVEYEVTANFYPLRSWYRAEVVDDYILSHEQTHFDITELHARKLRKRLSELARDASFKELSGEIYEQVEAERRAMQEAYDSQTDHSNHKSEEYQWQALVLLQLQEYDAWK